jgi:alkylation response protein AidB-like acyl-CoA dehydrogenase
MTVVDKHLKGGKRESLELAEESRQREWTYPSFVSRLFQGAINWDLVYPFPEQSREDKEEGDKYLKLLEEFLKEHLNPDEVDLTREIPDEVVKGLVEMGGFAMKIPKEYGGLGLSQLNYNRVVHLVSSYCGSTSALLSAHQSIGVPQPLLLFGTEEQKKRFLPKFRKGAISGFALTEVDAGSDPRMMKTTATPIEDGKYFLLNGEKLWCTNGNIADVLVVMAQTTPKIVRGKEKKQITAFIVETETPGFEVAYRCKFMGFNAIQNGLIRFRDVKVPKENIILGEGQGLKLAFVTLNTGRLALPAGVTGLSKWSLWVARQWANERKQWGSVIGEHEAIASKLSYMASTTFAMEAITWLTSFMADNKRFDIRLEAAMAKLFCSEESWKIVNEAIQIRGGRGYETAPSLVGRGKTGYALERAMRDMRVNTILEGSSEIMHLFIAREALDFHLKRMKPLLERKSSLFNKTKAAILIGFQYLTWYSRLWIPYFWFGRYDLKKPLGSHMVFVKKTSRRLARGLFHRMIQHQQKLAVKQNLINRYVDIGTDLFAMSCVCSYADKLYKEKDGKGNSIELADLFCRQARRRIQKNFKDVSSNDDRVSNKIAKKILAGEYEWLEEDIVKK